MTTRTDIHRTSQFRPDDYEYLFSFAQPDFPFPGYNTGLLVATMTGKPAQEPIWGSTDSGLPCITGHRTVTSPWGALKYFGRDSYHCDICGAFYKYGSAYRHRTTGETITIGYICADKADFHDNDSYLEDYRNRVAKARASYRATTQRVAAVREWARANRGLVRLLRTDHRIAKDMKARLISTGAKYGLSEKQVDLLKRLKAQADERAANPEVKVPAPATEDRIEITGTVVSAKYNEWERLVMTVKVETPDGIWLTWGSVPSSLQSSERQDCVERGDKIRFVAKVNVSDRDPSFSFFKRPTKAVFVARARQDAKSYATA